VTVTQTIFGAGLVLVLIVFGAYTAWKQWLALRTTNADPALSDEDREHFRKQAARRLTGAVLMFALAGVLVGAFFIEGRAQELADKNQALLDRGEKPTLNPEDRQFGEFYATVWIIVLLILLVLITLAGMDYLAIRRYGRRHYQVIRDERRAMIQEELRRYRREQSERN
jgi:uncharacterized membrane protein